MNKSKNTQIKVGIILICLVLVGTLFQPASGRGVEQNNNEGIVNSMVYLPMLRKSSPFRISRVSVSSEGLQGNAESTLPDISNDGRYVVFSSFADNLVPGDTNGQSDVFVHDRQTAQTVRVSVASDGTQGNERSGYYGNSSISADGRYVAFASAANNLVGNDTNNRDDIFVHDRHTGQTRIVSLASDGTQGNNWSLSPSISDDGQYIAFVSYATNLVNGDTNAETDVFVHNQQTGLTQRVSKATNGVQSNDSSSYPVISDNGRYIAFVSRATNLINNDTNDTYDVFVHDRQLEQTIRVSVASGGIQGNGWSSLAQYPSISADGRYVAFASDADNLVTGDTNGTVDIFVHDQQTGQTTRVSLASDGTQGGSSKHPAISANGRYVAFASDSYDWPSVLGINIYVHDRQTGQLQLVSMNSYGIAGDGTSSDTSISEDGRYIAFSSWADNLVLGDTNNENDIFVQDLGE